MTLPVEAPALPRRSSRSEYTFVAAAAGLAVVAALVAQNGLPRAQPVVGAIVILAVTVRGLAPSRA